MNRVVAESLEPRVLLFAFDPNLVHALPYALDFSTVQTGFEDKDNEGTGLTRVQFNNAGNQYQPAMIDLDTAGGVLKLTTSGLAQNGSNLDSDNSLINGLGAAFDATTTPFAITATLVGPLNFMNAASEQAGIMFGPDQDNYVKLVASFTGGRGKLQFSDEQTTSGQITHALVGSTVIGPFGLIGTLALRLIGDPGSGIVQAQYSVNGGNFINLPGRLTLTGSKKTAFFSSRGIASILAIQKNSDPALVYTFDDFSILGDASLTFQPSVTSVNPANGATDVQVDASVSALATIPTAGATIDPATLSSSTVKLVRTSDLQAVAANLNLSGDGLSATLLPTANLEPNTQYTFSITSGLKDTSGVAFQAFSSTFTTGVISSPGSISISKSRLVFNTVKGTSSAAQAVVITNTGSPAQTITAADITFTGAQASQFSFTTSATFPVTLTMGQTLTLNVKHTAPSNTTFGVKAATLEVHTEDVTAPAVQTALRSLATSGTGGTNEPSLQRILDLFQIPVTVGDSNPADVFLDTPPVTPNDEVTVQRLLRADSSQPVTIEPIAVFGVSSNPALRFGYYEPGTPDNRTLLWSAPTADAQSVNPVAIGTTSFDPGPGTFALLSIWPGFTNTDGSTREAYSEDSLNTFEPIIANQRKMRFYPLKNADGSAVANAYVVAVEEFQGGYDSNDVVAIVRNVAPAAAGPELGISNLDGVPNFNRMVFSRIQNPDTTFPNAVHDLATLRVRNTGTSNLILSSISISGPWQLQGTTTFPKTLAAGESVDLPIKFIATGGGLVTGSLVIHSNDADEPTRTIALSGFWQSYSERTPTFQVTEPTLQQIIDQFGYKTRSVNSGQTLVGGGKVEAVGDEILSPYWTRADASLPVTVRQLAAYHTQGNAAVFKWFTKGSSTLTTLFTEIGADGQTVLPRSTASGNPPAAGKFSTATTFGFNIDGESSDDTLNPQEQAGGGFGHHVRFYPLKDRDGNVVANSYLVCIDYAARNYDYQDDVYLVTNMRPEVGQALPPILQQGALFSMTPIKKKSDASALVDSVG